MTDTDFVGAAPSLFRHIGGTTEGTVSAYTYADSHNLEFGTEFATPVLDFLDPGAFSGTVSVATPGLGLDGSPYSLTSRVVVTHTELGQTTSFDNQVSVPEPAALALMGLGLAGFGYTRRRRKQN